MKTRLELEQENSQIQAELAAIREELLHKESVLSKKDAYIGQLTEALILARNRKFASAAESLREIQRHQQDLFNEAEQEDEGNDTGDDDVGLATETDPNTQTGNESDELDDSDESDGVIEIAAHSRRRGGRKPLPVDLPRIEVIHDLDESEKICPHDGHRLTEMKETVSEQLEIIPMKLQVIRHIRKHYACPCCEGYVKAAKKPTQPIPKSQASAGLLSFIAVSKYADSLPLYRQVNLFNRFNIDLNRTTLANWMIKCGRLVQPLINRIEDGLLESPYVHVDETPVQVLNEAGKSAQSQSYMWVRCAGPPGQRLILFDYDPSRSSQVPKKLLAEYTGAIMTDGYPGYEAVCRQNQIVRLGCWAHARRGFVKATKVSKKKVARADYVLKQIAKLYQLEKQLDRPHHPHLEETGWHQYRYAQRQDKAVPILDKLKDWLDENQPKVAPKTTLGKALGYLQSQWPRLIRYVEDGRYPIDNNPAENTIRPFAVGRKNWLFSTSVDGAKASANLYGLIETAKANGIEPYGYLKKVFTQIPNIKDYDDVDQLLPFNVKNVTR